MEEKIDTRLSYSSASLLTNCERRYYHYKVAKTKIDSDSSDSTVAFDVGKAFHGVLEDTMHSNVEHMEGLIRKQCDENNCLDSIPMVTAMVRKYLDLHRLTGLQAYYCEYAISTDSFIGYIDVILVDRSGGWWIGDLKTAAKLSPTLISRLRYDTQLNLYGSFYKMVAKDLELDPKKFLGMRYRVTTKPKLIQRKTEDRTQYIDRLKNSAKSYDIEVPVNHKIMEFTLDKHNKLYERSLQIRKGKKPTCNFTYCDSYFRPCPYWSQCYGIEFTKGQEDLILRDADHYEQERDLI